MTREEAKRVLEFDLDHTHNNESKEALRMAIKALEQEPCEDAISKQAAIDEIRFGQSYVTKISPTGAIEHLFDKENKALEEAVERIEELPSVNLLSKDYNTIYYTPQPKTGHCEDCKHFRKLPYHIDILGKCICHAGFYPKGDWYCADFEPQEREGTDADNQT